MKSIFLLFLVASRFAYAQSTDSKMELAFSYGISSSLFATGANKEAHYGYVSSAVMYYNAGLFIKFKQLTKGSLHVGIEFENEGDKSSNYSEQDIGNNIFSGMKYKTSIRNINLPFLFRFCFHKLAVLDISIINGYSFLNSYSWAGENTVWSDQKTKLNKAYNLQVGLGYAIRLGKKENLSAGLFFRGDILKRKTETTLFGEIMPSRGFTSSGIKLSFNF